MIESWTLPQLLLENADFLREVFDDDLLAAVHPSGDANQEHGNGIQHALITSMGLGDEHFPGDCPSRVGGRHLNSNL